jgi:hypothetical protein
MKMISVNIFFVFVIIFSFNSCDILRWTQFEVLSWTPGEGYFSQMDEIVVSMVFSRDPDRDSVERRFSLTADSGRIRGEFLWEGRKMTFSPLMPLEKNTDYNLKLSAEACDINGLSLDFPFEKKFTTRADTERPALVLCYPSMYAEVNDPKMEVQLEFSTPVTLNTLYDNISFNPSMTGIWRTEKNDKLAIFTPAESWIINRRYEIRFSTSLTDNKGMNIGNNFTSVFTVVPDNNVPELLYAGRITKDGITIPLDPDTGIYVNALEPLIESDGWEKDDRLLLVFSKPVDSLSVKNCLSVEDASSLLMETSNGFKTDFIFYFETTPVYESRFTFRLKAGVKDISGNENRKEYVYRIFTNGKFSKPPSLVGIRMPMALGNSEDKELVFFGIDSLFESLPIKDGSDNYPSGEKIKTWIELYFKTTEGASIDKYSLMELFRIETSNNVLSFSPFIIKTGDFSILDPHEGCENFERLEIIGILTNSTNFGIVSFLISSGLKDSLGNRNEKTMRISVRK